MESLAEEYGEFIVAANFNTKAGCFPLETSCRGIGYAHPVAMEFGAGGVQSSPVCCVRVKAGLWSTAWSVHSKLIFLILLIERRPMLLHMDTKITFKIQVTSRLCKKSRICKTSGCWACHTRLADLPMLKA